MQIHAKFNFSKIQQMTFPMFTKLVQYVLYLKIQGVGKILESYANPWAACLRVEHFNRHEYIPCRYTQLFLSACKITLTSNPRYTPISFLHLLFNCPLLIVHSQLYPNIANTQTYSYYNLTQPSLSTQQECTFESISIPILHTQHCSYALSSYL